MKKTLFITLIFTLGALNLFSQDKKIYVGLKGGLNIATMTNLGTSSSSSFGGIKESSTHPASFLPHLGVYTELKFSDFISLQPELLYSVKGSKYNYEYSANKGQEKTSYSRHLNLYYLDIPIQLRFNMGKGFHILAGPSVSILLSARTKEKREDFYFGDITREDINDKSKNNFNTIDIGMYLGFGYQLKNGLNFGFRWNRGFSDVFEDLSNNHQNTVLQLSTGFAF